MRSGWGGAIDDAATYNHDAANDNLDRSSGRNSVRYDDASSDTVDYGTKTGAGDDLNDDADDGVEDGVDDGADYGVNYSNNDAAGADDGADQHPGGNNDDGESTDISELHSDELDGVGSDPNDGRPRTYKQWRHLFKRQIDQLQSNVGQPSTDADGIAAADGQGTSKHPGTSATTTTTNNDSG